MAYFSNFYTKLTEVQEQTDRLTALQSCMDRTSGDYNTVCYKISNGKIHIATSSNGNGIGNEVSPDISNGLAGVPSTNNEIKISDIYGKLLTNKTGGYNTVRDLNADIRDLSGGIDMIKVNGSKSVDFARLLTTHNSIKETRDDLDRKMRDLYDNEYTDNRFLHDQSVYATLAWTVLATSILYYIFVKI
jgi:hypothetical protein